jgi:hypothetical protein
VPRDLIVGTNDGYRISASKGRKIYALRTRLASDSDGTLRERAEDRDGVILWCDAAIRTTAPRRNVRLRSEPRGVTLV